MLESRRRTEALSGALEHMSGTTQEAFRCCELLTKRAQQLDSLTSPASDASSMLSRANANLAATLILLKDAREKFDTVADCEPAIQVLVDAGGETKKRGVPPLTEQDVYAAGDSMDILRDAYQYFVPRKSWRSVPTALSGLERVHQMGLDAMAALIQSHLKSAGQGVRPKKLSAKVLPYEETAHEVGVVI